MTADDVYREGISSITAADLTSARALNCTIKLLALCERVPSVDGKDRVSARVYPALVPREHPLASVNGAFNAVVVEAESSGRLMFYGQGAGGAPTASAVLSDVVAAASHRVHGGHAPRESVYAHLPILDPGSARTRYQMRLRVEDRLGVLSEVANIFARHGVSIQSVHQRDGQGIGQAVIVIATHVAREADLQAVAHALSQSPAVREVASTIRMEGD